jgi:hypothetical protein
MTDMVLGKELIPLEIVIQMQILIKLRSQINFVPPHAEHDQTWPSNMSSISSSWKYEKIYNFWSKGSKVIFNTASYTQQLVEITKFTSFGLI